MGGARLVYVFGLVFTVLGGLTGMILMAPYRMKRLMAYQDPSDPFGRFRLFSPHRLWARRVSVLVSAKRAKALLPARGSHRFRIFDLGRGVGLRAQLRYFAVRGLRGPQSLSG